MDKQEAKDKLMAISAAAGGSDIARMNRALEISTIVDAITPDKVVLPKAVGEAWDKYVANMSPTAVGTKLECALNSVDVNCAPAVADWYGKTPGALLMLADAARYGWTPEPERRWYVKVPGNWGGRQRWYAVKHNRLAYGYETADLCSYEDYDRHAFTSDELKQFGLSDAQFTHVEVADND